MIYCYECKRLSTSGSKYCVRCMKSFGGRLCEHGHPSPRDAKCCQGCGSKELSKAANSLNLRLPVLAVGWIIAILLLKALATNLSSILALAWRAVALVIQFVIGADPEALIAQALCYLVVPVTFAYCFSFMLPKEQRKAFLGALIRFLVRLVRVIPNGLLRLLTLIAKTVQGREPMKP